MTGKKRKEHQHGAEQEKTRAHRSKKNSRHHEDEDDEEEHEYLEPKLSAKILEEAVIQQKEILFEESRKSSGHARDAFSAAASAISVPVGFDSDDDDDGGSDLFSDTQSQYDGYQYHEIDEEDEKILAAFTSKDAGPQWTLADIIIERIKEKDALVASEARPVPPQLDSGIIELYKGVGKLLSRYTTGKLPKAFKVVPALSLWEDVLYLTELENWSPNAMYQATRIFASNFSPKRAQRFYNLVLLPRVRDDILKNKRLHFALYQSLKKSLYKPAAFFKGFFLPLCQIYPTFVVDMSAGVPEFHDHVSPFDAFERVFNVVFNYMQSGTCNLREAVIIGSVIQKLSIPPLHSSAALMKIAQMDYCGTTSYFIKLFLEKKYALPYRVLDAVTTHFMRFLDDERAMPVIWHQSLLTFVQRYKNELTKDDKEDLERLINRQKHYLVTPEIRRELKNSRCRGEKEDASPSAVINKTIEEDRWDYPEVPMEED